jgi:RNA-directed DNA polymerase
LWLDGSALRARCQRSATGATRSTGLPSPIFEADLDPEAYGYRPERSAVDAVRRVHGHLRITDVVDAVTPIGRSLA